MIIKDRLEDALVSIPSLKYKVNSLILPFSCFFRDYEPIADFRTVK